MMGGSGYHATKGRGEHRSFPYPAVLALSVLLSAAAFLLLWRFDNKYTAPRPRAGQGLTRIDMAWYGEHPFFYLIEGWELYNGKLLTPDDIPGQSPDIHLYIGQYGGFDLGDPNARPRGAATYHTVLLTDSVEREYALELTDIYSAWRLWVNGRLVQSVGMGDKSAPAPDSRMVTFTAAKKIDIVVAVWDNRGFYSGMVYPPAFGSPALVGRAASLRLLLHATVCGLAVFIALLCLLMAAVRSRSGEAFPTAHYFGLALLCLCLTGATIWPVPHALGIGAGWWTVLERLCYYSMFLTLSWLLASICGVPRRAMRAMLAAGLAVCISVPLQPLFPAARAGALMAYANLLACYKWFTAAWLLGTCLWAIRAGRRHSKALLAGSGVFATALALSKMLPLYEPIIGGWFVEQAGGFLMLIAAWVVWYDTVLAFRERVALREEMRLAEVRLEAQNRHARLQQEYVAATRERLHETGNAFTLLRHYLDAGRLEQLSGFLDEQIGSGTAPGRSGQYTGNSLVDAILSLQMARIEEADIYVEAEFLPLPTALGLADGDVLSLLMNLLDNAIEACGRIPDPAARWIFLRVGPGENAALSILCENAALGPPPARGTSKEDKLAHGHGLAVLRRIARENGGTFDAVRLEDSFRARVAVGKRDKEDAVL